jgi:hypothetical protein
MAASLQGDQSVAEVIGVSDVPVEAGVALQEHTGEDPCVGRRAGQHTEHLVSAADRVEVLLVF